MKEKDKIFTKTNLKSNIQHLPSDRKGITLIALVITIVIMLILATVTIGAINGGLFDYTGKAKREVDRTEEKQIISVVYLKAKGDSKTGRITETGLKKETDKYEDVKDVTVLGDSFLIEFINGKEYILDQQGNIKEKKGLLAFEIPSTDYGNYVFNYSDIDVADGGTTQLADWQILYAGKVSNEGENHIYLIASNCISIDSLPIAKNNYAITKSTSDDYTGTFKDVRTCYDNGSDDIIEETKYLNNEYFKFLKINNRIIKNNNNIKALAYMCDTSIWNIFKTQKADFVIGGPTIELFVKSYNKKNNTSIKHGYITVDEERKSCCSNG